MMGHKERYLNVCWLDLSGLDQLLIYEHPESSVQQYSSSSCIAEFPLL
jgi:hypothetical protein